MATYKELQDRADRLVLVPTNCVILAREWDPDGAAPITTVVDEDGVLLDFAELGFETVGMIEQKSGVDMSPDLKFGAIMGYGARGARRRPKESEDFSLGFTIQEQRSIGTRIAMNVLSEQIVSDGNGGWYVKKEDTDDALYWDILVIAYDGKLGSEIYPWWWYPRMGLSEGGKKAMSMTEALGEPVTLSVFEDDTNGLYYRGITGEGWAPLNGLGGFPGAVARLVTITGTPAGGTFTITVDGQTTSGIAYNAAASAVQTAIAALSTVGIGNVTVTGSAGGPYTITLANGGTLSANGAGLTGGSSPAVGVASI